MRMKFILISCILNLSLFANTMDYILNTSGLLDERAYKKINEIGNEVKVKLGVNIYLDIKGNNGIDIKLDRETRIRQQLSSKIVSIQMQEYTNKLNHYKICGAGGGGMLWIFDNTNTRIKFNIDEKGAYILKK